MFVAACNPYQFKKVSKNSKNDVVYVHPTKENFLSHKVLPISFSSLMKIHDYGSLGENVEQAYIRGIMSTLFRGKKKAKYRNFWANSPQEYLDNLVSITSFCQKYIKSLNKNHSTLSLRDVERTKKVFEFYLVFQEYKKTYSRNQIPFEKFRKTYEIEFEKISMEQFMGAVIVSVSLNYLNRIVLHEERAKLIEEVEAIFKRFEVFKIYNYSVNKTMENEYAMIIQRLKDLGSLPKDLAVNTALKENLFSIFVSIYSRIPLFICGKPGSSKSVSVDIIRRSYDGQKIGGSHDFLDGMKPIKIHYYQGSDQSTDKGINKVFEKAIYEQQKGGYQSVVFIDEIGLAELSPNNPLKVLHKYLDTTSHDFGKGG